MGRKNNHYMEENLPKVIKENMDFLNEMNNFITTRNLQAAIIVLTWFNDQK